MVNLILSFEKRLKELSFSKDYQGYKLLSNNNHMLPWIKVKARRYDDIPCPGIEDELCWAGRWSGLEKDLIIEEDFDGAPYENASPFESSMSTYFRV